MFKPCVIIPVYDHEGAVASVVARLRAQDLPVLLVDDGSGPQCAALLQRLAEQHQVSLLRHERNRGKGAAVVTGLRAAHQAGFTHALQVDADGQHDIEQASAFIAAARAAPEALVCGHPVFDASIPKVRYYGRYLTHVLVWVHTLSLDIIDSMCGFRVYPLGPTLAVLQRSRVGARMDFDTEILVRLHWQGVPMRWLPIAVTYPQQGVSHFRFVRDNVLMTRLHARLLVGMLLRLPRLLWRRLSPRQY